MVEPKMEIALDKKYVCVTFTVIFCRLESETSAVLLSLAHFGHNFSEIVFIFGLNIIFAMLLRVQRKLCHRKNILRPAGLTMHLPSRMYNTLTCYTPCGIGCIVRMAFLTRGQSLHNVISYCETKGVMRAWKCSHT